jgi:putative oxidoreductase
MIKKLVAASYGALLLRLLLGGLFIAHLYRKFAISGFDNWWDGLSTAGYPAWVLAYTLSAEFACAVMITLGIHSRWASLYAFPFMVGATIHWFTRKGFFFTDAGYELPLVWAVLLIVQGLVGDGAYSVGALLRKNAN